MKTRLLSYLLLLGILLVSMRAGDHVIVVDTSNAMNGFLTLKNDRKRTFKRQKKGQVQKQLRQYLNQIPDDGSRVYLVFYHSGIAEWNKQKLATEFTFNSDGRGKKAALAQADNYPKFVPRANIPNPLFPDSFNHLWSSLHKALQHAEKNKYYQPADPKTGKPEIFPNILIITDSPDDFWDLNGWTFGRVAPQPKQGGPEKINILPGLVQPKKQPPAPGNVILLKHQWLLRHSQAVWYQYGYTDPVSKHWKGTIIRINFNDNLSVVPPVNPPVIVRTKPGKIKLNEPIPMRAAGDRDRVLNFQWSTMGKDGRMAKAVSGSDFAPKFDKPGFYTINLEAIHKIANDQRLSTQLVVQVGENAKPPPPPPPPPSKPPVIAAAFTLQVDGPDKKPKPIKNADTLWTFEEDGVQVSFKNQTTAKLDGKEDAAPLLFDWALGGAQPGKDTTREPARKKFKPGTYSFGLTASQKDNPKNRDEADKVTFTIQLAQVKPTVKNAKGSPLKIKPGQPVEFLLEKTNVPKGTKFVWDFGDGSKAVQEENPKHIFQKLSPPKNPFKPKLTVTLPDGQSNEYILDTQVEVSRDAIAAKATPAIAWPGEPVKLQLADVDLKQIEKVTWIVAGKTNVAQRADQFALTLPFQETGPQKVTYEVKKINVTESIRGEHTVTIRGVNPVATTEEKEVYIGQPVTVTIANQPGEPPFPKGHRVNLAGPDLKQLPSGQWIFTTAGENKEIMADVNLPGASQAFAAAPVTVRVKPVTPEIGIK